MIISATAILAHATFVLPEGVKLEYLMIGFLGWAFGSMIKGKSKIEGPAWKEHVAGGTLSLFLVIYGIESIKLASIDTIFENTEGWILFFLTAGGTPWAKTIIDVMPTFIVDWIKGKLKLLSGGGV